MDISKFLQGKINTEKLKQVTDNVHYKSELSLFHNNKVKNYYQHILDNVSLNPFNTKNSYIMWIYDKVTNLDENSPVKISLGRVSLPDIDSDFPKSARDNVVQYIRDKWGHHRVCQMMTYGRLQGKAVLTEVLRVHSACSFAEMKTISKLIPDEARISDELQAMKRDTGESSIIRWALKNNSKDLKQYCYIDEDGNLAGPLAQRFEQAIRLEGTKKSIGKHAAGVIIAPDDLTKYCPMIYDQNSNHRMAGMEMGYLEKICLVKLDCLTIDCLDKITGAQKLIRTGKIC